MKALKALKAFLLALAFTGFGLWDIYRGKAGIPVEWWWWRDDQLGAPAMGPYFTPADSPFMFWFCVSGFFVTAVICLVVAVAYASPES